MGKRYFSKKIVEWYQQNKRELPWRLTKDPYKIWLSEIILQQTRVAQGLPYYERFVSTFPTVTSLANAPEQQVLRLWQGLGYYTRARNLRKCAIEVAVRGAVFPDKYSDLKKLPGIGDYTAAAIASFCFAEPVAVVDGNVFRVLSRVFGIDSPINRPEGQRYFRELANSLIPDHEPGIFNQAIMEFGGTFCTPRNPDCLNCIFRKTCVAFQHSLQDTLPVKVKAKQQRSRYFTYLVFKKGNSLLMRERTAKDIWSGLFDFVLIETEQDISPKKAIQKSMWSDHVEPGSISLVSSTYKHVLTHQTITARFVLIESKLQSMPRNEGDKRLKFYPYKAITQLPKPVLINRYLNDSGFLS